jgi:hypothetical protein
MKQTVQPTAEQGQKAAAGQMRSRPARQQAMAHDGWLTQLAAMVNASPRVENLAALKNGIRQSPSVQDLMTLSAQINQGLQDRPEGTSEKPAALAVAQRVILDDDEPLPDEEVETAIAEYPEYIQDLVRDIHGDEEAGFTLEQALEIAHMQFREDHPELDLAPEASSKKEKTSGSTASKGEPAVGMEDEPASEDEGLSEETLAELAKVTVNVLPSRGDQVSVNLGEYFRNPKNKKFSNVSILALQQEVVLQYTLEETNPGRDPDRFAALHWAREELTFPPLKKGGGGGNLTVRYDAASDAVEVHGRPGFEKEASELPGMRRGFHRRHIVAWHTLKAALQNVVNELIKLQGKEPGIQHATDILVKFSNLIGPEPEAPEKIKRKSKKLKTPERPLPTKASNDPEELVVLMKRVLSKINSNVFNLWPGEGYENSLINTYQVQFREWAGAVAGMSNEEIGPWRELKIADLQKRADAKKGRYQAVLQQFVTLITQWQPEKSDLTTGAQLSGFLKNCADNFEVDFPFSPDRESFAPGQVISTHIIGMAGALLDWAEGGDKAFKGKNATGLGIELENFLNQFMFPAKEAGIGKSGGSSGKDPGSKGPIKPPVEPEPAFARVRVENFVSVPQIGNSCYIASVMNTVLTIKAYRDLFLNNQHEETYNAQIFGVLNTGRALLLAMNGGRGTEELVTAFRTALLTAGWLGGNIEFQGRQQDAGELLTFLLDLLGNKVTVRREHRWKDRGNPAEHQEHAASNILNLGGLHAQGNARTIEDLLADNLHRTRGEPEQLAGGTVRLHNWRLEGALPAVLTIQMNRFNFSTLFARVFKLKEKITAGLNLTIPGTLTADGVAVNYRLSSFILHIGESTSSGHYISYQRRNDSWLLIDDDSGYEVTPAEVLAKVQDAYLLSYERT